MPVSSEPFWLAGPALQPAPDGGLNAYLIRLHLIQFMCFERRPREIRNAHGRHDFLTDHHCGSGLNDDRGVRVRTTGCKHRCAPYRDNVPRLQLRRIDVTRHHLGPSIIREILVLEAFAAELQLLSQYLVLVIEDRSPFPDAPAGE